MKKEKIKRNLEDLAVVSIFTLMDNRVIVRCLVNNEKKNFIYSDLVNGNINENELVLLPGFIEVYKKFLKYIPYMPSACYANKFIKKFENKLTPESKLLLELRE